MIGRGPVAMIVVVRMQISCVVTADWHDECVRARRDGTSHDDE